MLIFFFIRSLYGAAERSWRCFQVAYRCCTCNGAFREWISACKKLRGRAGSGDTSGWRGAGCFWGINYPIMERSTGTTTITLNHVNIFNKHSYCRLACLYFLSMEELLNSCSNSVSLRIGKHTSKEEGKCKLWQIRLKVQKRRQVIMIFFETDKSCFARYERLLDQNRYCIFDEAAGEKVRTYNF